jgi:hypothetical protein
MLSINMLIVIMPSMIKLIVIMLNVVLPIQYNWWII